MFCLGLLNQFFGVSLKEEARSQAALHRAGATLGKAGASVPGRQGDVCAALIQLTLRLSSFFCLLSVLICYIFYFYPLEMQL